MSPNHVLRYEVNMDGRKIKLVGRVKTDVITLFTISQNLKSVDPLPSNSILIKIYNQNGYVKQSTHKNLALAFFLIMRRNCKQTEFLTIGD